MNTLSALDFSAACLLCEVLIALIVVVAVVFICPTSTKAATEAAEATTIQ